MALSKFEDNGVTYLRLHMKCPMCFGHDKHMGDSGTFWKHGNRNCNGDIYVGDNAFYKCVKCGTTVHVSNWTYSCPSCSNSSDAFVKVGIRTCAPQTLAVAMSTSSTLVNESGCVWLQKFFANME